MNEIVKWDWVDGPCLVALCSVTDPPGWLKRGTRASFGWIQFSGYVYNGWEHASGGIVKEGSILSPAERPTEPCAEVILYKPAGQPKPRPARSAATPAAGEVFHGAGPYAGREPLARRNLQAEA